MKMLKKLLAVALAGMLALSVLTGCDSSSKSFVDALNEAGSAKFTYDQDLQNESLSAANISMLENTINTAAKADPSKSKDAVVADVLAANMAAENQRDDPVQDGTVTVTDDDPMLYAVVWNADTASTTQQAKNALHNAKNLTLNGYKVKNSTITTVDYTLDAAQLNSTKGYAVAFAKLHTDLGTLTLAAFIEND